MGEYFFDFVEVFLDLAMLLLQFAVQFGLTVGQWIDALLPVNVNWNQYWATMPADLISLGKYIGVFECFGMVMSATSFKYIWRLVRGR